MTLKLIVAIIDPQKTEILIETARKAGATGATIVNNVRGEGMFPVTGLLGLQLDAQKDLVLFVVRADRAEAILDEIATVCDLNDKPGTGIAFQLDVDKAAGLRTQIPEG